MLSKTKGARFAPIAISDDGAKTYFQIPQGAATPIVFRVDAKGLEYAVNSTMNGSVIVVAGRSDRWVVRYGDDHACIEGK
ncbi:TrbG/VirB9 family P-type conjugative transfer protein [Paracoccus cavernae]|uniref:TrbG/VirB9 family P-type conjugative transfer protein n=1 Tax=Paracoccus cavernae TaxID=1571207 RepID=UPI00362839A9